MVVWLGNEKAGGGKQRRSGGFYLEKKNNGWGEMGALREKAPSGDLTSEGPNH